MENIYLLLIALGANFLMIALLRSKGKFWNEMHKRFGDKNIRKNRLRSVLLSESGEANGDGGTGDGKTGEITFTPEQQKFIDKTIDRRVADIKSRYTDYDDLKKFKEQHSKESEQKQQKELEDQKKYEESKKIYEGKIGELSTNLSKKDQEINDLRITHALTNEVVRQNGYTEEALALLKSQTSLDANGNVVIKMRDANGIEQTIPAAEGVKKLLEAKPYLVRSTHKQGSGTGSGNGTGGNGAGDGANHGDQDLKALNEEYMKYFYAGDLKKAREIKVKINEKMRTKTAAV